MHNNSQTQPLLRADGVRYQVDTLAGELVILSGIDLSLNKGESLAIVGASGSGKSTLLGLLGALEQPSEGSIWLMGHRTDTLDEAELARLRQQYTAFVFQSFELLSELNALENVLLPLEFQRAVKAEERAREALDAVGLSNRMAHYPHQLSGGEQQRVALARAYALKPQLLFADEPTGNLDSDTGARVQKLMFDLVSQSDTALVLVTHDESLAQQCDRSLHLQVQQS